jgi:hypothetical protein
VGGLSKEMIDLESDVEMVNDMIAQSRISKENK